MPSTSSKRRASSFRLKLGLARTTSSTSRSIRARPIQTRRGPGPLGALSHARLSSVLHSRSQNSSRRGPSRLAAQQAVEENACSPLLSKMKGTALVFGTGKQVPIRVAYLDGTERAGALSRSRSRTTRRPPAQGFMRPHRLLYRSRQLMRVGRTSVSVVKSCR